MGEETLKKYRQKLGDLYHGSDEEFAALVNGIRGFIEPIITRYIASIVTPVVDQSAFISLCGSAHEKENLN